MGRSLLNGLARTDMAGADPKVRRVSIYDVLTQRDPRSDPTLSNEPKIKKKPTRESNMPRQLLVR